MCHIREIKIENLTFNCRAAGNSNGELVIFMHGFPETSVMWKDLLSDISANGFYSLAPDLRGYSKEACPSGKKHYGINKLVSDVMGIANSIGRSQFHLVGHDWGAAIGWKLVHDFPNSVLSWTAMSVPHLQAFGSALVNDPEQGKMSSYIKSFQWPFLPERMIRKNDFKLFRKLWKNSSQEEIQEYLTVFSHKKQLTAALNYYRSNYKLLKKAAKTQILGEIKVPTLFIWGNRDPAIGSTAVKEGHKYVKSDYQYLELDAGHWLVQTQYQEVKSAINKHLIRNRLS